MYVRTETRRIRKRWRAICAAYPKAKPMVFRYDKTFEGLLTAIFDAYTRRTFPERLVGPGEPLPMFAGEVYEVLTDRSRAERVWRGLQKKLGAQVCNMLSHVWLSEEAGSDELLLRYMRKAFDATESIALNFTDEDVLNAEKVARRVSKERMYLVQFVRFQKAADGTYFAPVEPRFNALPLCIDYFTDRFADQRWLLYDIRRRYGYYYDLKKAVEITMEEDEQLLKGWLDESLAAGDEKLFQERWAAYFRSITIRERINPKAHRGHMPRRFWKFLPEKR